MKKIISLMLAAIMIFSCMQVVSFASLNKNIKNEFETKGGFLDVEAERLPYDDGLYSVIEGDLYSRGKALAPLKEDKVNPAAEAEPGLKLEFSADMDGTYYVWVRHTAKTAKMSGANVWMAVGDGKYTNTAFKGNENEIIWYVIGKVEVKAGEKGLVKFIPRQVANVSFDRFIVTNNAEYVPTDSKLKIKTSIEAQTVVPEKPAVPAILPVTESGYYPLVDMNDEENIKKSSMTAVEGETNKFCAQWKLASPKSFFFDVKDVSNYNTLKVRLKGVKDQKLVFKIIFYSENSAQDGSDFYSIDFSVEGDEWKEYSFVLNQIQSNRSPRGLNDLDRIGFTNNGWGMENPTGATITFDYINFYSDKELAAAENATKLDKELADKQYESATAADDYSKIKDAVCLYLGESYSFSKLERVAIDPDNLSVVPFVENGRTLVPIRFISEKLGAAVSYDATSRTVTITKDANVISLAIDSDILVKNGVETKLDVTAKIYNDRTFVPLRACAEALDKKVFWDDLGLIILSDYDNVYDSTIDRKVILAIISEMIFDRPTGEQMMADLRAKYAVGEHPRLLADSKKIAEMKEMIAEDPVVAGWFKTVEKGAQGILEQNPPTYTITDGRLLFQSQMARNHLIPIAFLYQMTGDEKYAQRVWKELEAVCAFPDWHPSHFLDTGELAFCVSFAYDWCYDYFTPEQREFIENSLYINAIEAGIGSYHGVGGTHNRSGWVNATTNWNAICNTGLIYSTVALADSYPEKCAELMGYIVGSLERGVYDYAPDGGYAEGPGYWDYGTLFAVYGLAGMDTAFGSNYGLDKFPGVGETGYYALYIEGPQGTFNYSDSNSGPMDTTMTFWFANKLNDSNLAGLRYNELISNPSSASLKDLLWYDKDNINRNVSLSNDIVFDGIGTAVLRTSWTDASTVYAAIHGGKNNSNHGQLDAGTFVLDAENIRWFMDLGGESYSLPDYFGAKRHNYYRSRGEGQNTVTVNPNEQPDQTPNAVANIIKSESKSKGGYAVVDMSAALGLSKVDDAKRGMMLTNNRRSVIIQDEISLKEPGEVYWFAHTDASVTLSADGKSAILYKNGKRLAAVIVSENDAKFTVEEPVALPTSPERHELENKNTGVKKLRIHMTDVKDVKLAVAFRILSDYETDATTDYTYTNIDNWYIEDGEMIEPVLSDLQIDGKTVENFNPYLAEYTVKYPYGTTAFPKVSASAAGNYEVEVIVPEKIDATAYIRVTDKNNPGISKTYSVYATSKAGTEILASHYQEGNPPENALDGDLGTRWSADSDAWIKFTFDEPRDISAVYIAFWKAAARKTDIEIEISEDGENFTVVYDGYNTLDAEELEEFKLPQTVKAKAIRISCHGTTGGIWNSVLEVDFK